MSSVMPYEYQADLCTQCGACVGECPIARFHRYAVISEVRPTQCLRCGHCAVVCLTGAIAATKVRREDVSSGMVDDARELFRLMSMRHSVRHFYARAVDRTHLELLLSAMREAPSGMNARPVHAVVVTDPEKLRTITSATITCLRFLATVAGNPIGKLFLRLLSGMAPVGRLLRVLPEMTAIAAHDRTTDPILHGAPAAIILHASRTSPTGHDDCLLAAMNAMLIAPTVGLGTCMIGFALPAFEYMRMLRRVCNIPPDHEVYAVIAVGHPATRYRQAPFRPDIPVRWV